MSGRRLNGFTLLEVLVALAVAALLLVGVSRDMRLGVQLWNREASAADAAGEIDAVDRTLRGLIEQLDPGGAGDTASVAGTSAWLRFTTELPVATGAPPTRRAEVILLVDDHHRLLLRWRSAPHAALLMPARMQDTVLLDGVDRLDISYRTRDGWRANWQGPRPPDLLRIHIGFAAGDARRWPDIYLAPLRGTP